MTVVTDDLVRTLTTLSAAEVDDFFVRRLLNDAVPAKHFICLLVC
jgi:hypothetical protein